MATHSAGSNGSTVALLLLTLLFGGCSASRIVVPEGPGVPRPDYHDLFEAVIAPCRQVRTIELMLAIRGHTGDTTLRGRVRGAFARPASLRLEGLAPFGPPAFVLVTGSASPVLLLPREQRVVTDATGRDLLLVLAGLDLAPADFQAVLTGCLVPEPHPLGARTYRNGWVGIELAGDATLYLDIGADTPTIVAGTRPGFVVEYGDHIRGLPRQVRLRTGDPDVGGTDVTATMSQVSINVEVDEAAFVPMIPDSFTPMSVEALRATAGPLDVSDPSDP